MLSSPAVTVIVPSYNYAHYLHGALNGLLLQTWGDFECLVVEDGSTDNSLEVARDFAARDSRVRVLTHPDGKNHGLHASLGLALAQAKGIWTAFLEADDLWEPHCLAERLAVAKHSGAGVVCNDIAPMIMPGAEVDWFEGYVPRVMRWHAERQCAAEAKAATAARAASPLLTQPTTPNGASAAPCGATLADTAATAASTLFPQPATPNGASAAPCGAPVTDTAQCRSTENAAAPPIPPRPLHTPLIDVAPFLLENKIPTFSCAMVKTDLLRGVCLQTPVPRWLDWWVWAQLASTTSFAFCPKKLTQWRLHPESWHHKVEMQNYIEDFRSIGQGFRRLFTRKLVQQKRLGMVAFLWLPASVRLFARMALTAKGDSMAGVLRRIASRLEISKKNSRF